MILHDELLGHPAQFPTMGAKIKKSFLFLLKQYLLLKVFTVEFKYYLLFPDKKVPIDLSKAV